MENLKHLTTGEENLMKVIWNLNKNYLKDILSACPEPKPHQNTVSTFLKNLVKKNYLTTKQEGRAFRYDLAVSKKTFRMFLLKNLIQDFYNSNPNELLEDLMNEGLIQLSVSEKEKEKKKKKKKKK